MVGRAASQKGFRALKHCNGIEGEPTIIVRVIACFQPLQDCQVSNVLLILGIFQFLFFLIILDMIIKVAV